MCLEASSFAARFPSKPDIRTTPDDGRFLLLVAFEVTTSSGELAEEELLGHICANSFRDADREVSEDQPSTTIGSGIVKVCETG